MSDPKPSGDDVSDSQAASDAESTFKESREVTDEVEGIPLVPEPSRDRLTERQQVDYAEHRRTWLEWCLTKGKEPKKHDGYATSTIENRAARVDQFFRWLWEEDGYTTIVEQDHGDAFLKELAFSDYSQDHCSNQMKALKCYFKWLHHEQGYDEYDPEYTFSTPNRQSQTKDVLTREERKKIREAALEYGSIPHYNSVDPEERSRWKAHLAQRFGVPKTEIGLDHWDRANGWKFTSLTWTSLDAGLRPCEVAAASTAWLDLSNARLIIPREDNVKVSNEEESREWRIALTDRTVEALRRWTEQREAYPKYDDTDKLWLTKYGNAYSASELSELIDRLADIADIDTTNRQLTWYSIRGATTTEMIDESDLSTAAEQVRHRDIRTTRRYDQAPEKRRRNTLEKLG